MRLRRFIALVIAVAALSTAAYLVALTIPEIMRLWTPATAPQAEVQPTPPATEPESPKPEFFPALLQPVPDAPSSFVTLPLIKPVEFCKALEGMGLRNPTFQPHEPPDPGWTCVPEILKPVDGDEATVSSLFVAARGDDADRVSSIRIKLNLLDPSNAPVAKDIAKDLLRRMVGALGGQPPAAVIDAIEAMRDGQFTDRGVVYELKKEFGSSPRSNLIVTFPARLGAGGEDRFVPPPGRFPG